MATREPDDGAVTGGVRLVMQTEGLAAFAVAVLLYVHAGASWQLFAVLFLAPDLSMLGYVAGARIGALAYNLAHSYVGPVAIAAYCLAANDMLAMPFVFIWVAHIGLDRMLGFGLKYADAFGHTHLGLVGRPVRQRT
jgi:hypothetical protein